jgi:hypothetical protein
VETETVTRIAQRSAAHWLLAQPASGRTAASVGVGDSARPRDNPAVMGREWAKMLLNAYEQWSAFSSALAPNI